MTQRGNEPLEELLGSLAATIAETLNALVGRSLTAELGTLLETNPEKLLSEMNAQHAVVRGALDKDYAGQTVRFLSPAREASTLSDHLMMSADETIEEHRKKGTLDGESLETFSEIANVLCSGVDTAIREKVTGDVVLRCQDHGVVARDADPEDYLGGTNLVAFMFPFTIDGYPESEVTILLEPETAERWNGGPLGWSDEQGSAEPAQQAAEPAGPTELASSAEPAGLATTAPEPVVEDDLEEIPEAPICGQLAVYLLDKESLQSIRKSCRRIGLELDRHAPGKIPNPSAHRGDVVVIEVPPADAQRFEWCRRLKTFAGDIKVILLLRSPTRHEVVQGFIAEADAILGLPFTEPQLSNKLALLMEEDESE